MKRYVRQSMTAKIIIWICSQIATLGPIGYLPAPGTMGTLCAIPLLVGLRYLENFIKFIDEGIILALLFLGFVWIINKALQRLKKNDPSEIVLDEVLGFFVVMIFLPLKPLIIGIAFVCFRFFDIVKPFGIERAERIPGSWGIILDDIFAAFFARIIVDITLLFISR